MRGRVGLDCTGLVWVGGEGEKMNTNRRGLMP
jgi:hypothetical protein